MQFEIVNQNEWIFADQIVSEKGSKSIVLNTAKEAYTSVQILLNDIEADAQVYWNCTLPQNISMEVYQQIDVLCEKNTGPVSFCVDPEKGESAEGYTIRKAPFRVYDAIRPIQSGEITFAHETAAMYVSFFVGACEAKKHEIDLEFHIGDASAAIHVCINVFDVAVPAEKNLYISNWYRLDNIARQHHVTEWSDEHWELIEKYADLMARTRQTHFWIPNEAREIVKTGPNQYEFKFDRIKRLITLFLKKGFTHIEGNLLYSRKNFSDSGFVVDILGEVVPALSQEAEAFMTQYLAAWKNFLEDNHWLSLLVQHVGDEPTDICKDEYKTLAKFVRKRLPGVKLLEAIETYEIEDAVDILIPKNNYYQEHRDAFEQLRNSGKELWFYTCCFPGGYYLNRFWDMPLIRTRLLHWGNYRYDLKGYLHWGFNWCFDKDPYNQTELFFPPGDTHLVYPFENRPIGSMRLESMRAGVQDFELLYMLAQKNEKLANELCESCLEAFDKPNEDIAHFENIRVQILQALQSYYRRKG